MSNKTALVPPRPRGVAVIFDRHGRPKVDDGWVESLSPEDRIMAEHALNSRGFRLNGNSIEEIDDGNSGNRRA